MPNAARKPCPPRKLHSLHALLVASVGPGPLHPPEDLLTRSHALHFARVWMQAKKKRGATNGTPALLATTPHDADTSPHCPGIASCKQNRQRAHVPPPALLPPPSRSSTALLLPSCPAGDHLNV
ncbi:hypothetical protein B0H14DRAFT_3453345 [Mycena olivaceomarginata]|nr:hypothetical protein B0H14DRAFT_3453345 [Mycena olivaceomarginata]